MPVTTNKDPSDDATIEPVPSNYRQLRIGGPFAAFNGPLFGRLDDDGMSMGFQVEKRHLNPAGICHGGMLMTLADMQLGVGSMAQTKAWEFLPTVNMTCDFVQASPMGAFVFGTTDVIRVTKNLLFASCILWHGEEPVFRGSGIMKRAGKDESRTVDLERFFEPGEA
jgi:uncharacterized protein (TIGR00369 family)